MKNYIISIISSAIFCSVVASLFSDKVSTGKMVRLLSGILMAVTILAPFKNISFRYISTYFNTISAETDVYVNAGKESSKENTAAFIRERTEAYILDKAKTMNLDVSVEVELNDVDSVPCGITIKGAVAPYEKSIMQNYIEQMLGISKEKQIWI